MSGSWGGRSKPIYPFAPDSTIVRFILPLPLAPGDSMTVEMDWDARPSTVPRRQGRRGRAYDFAQWYPKVVVYDKYGWKEHPLYPGGEFYGEFADFPGESRFARGPGHGCHRCPGLRRPWMGAGQPGARSSRLSISGTSTRGSRTPRGIGSRRGRRVRGDDATTSPERSEAPASGTPRSAHHFAMS